MAAGDISLQILISAVDKTAGVVNGIMSSLSQLAGGNVLGAVATAATAAGAAIVGIGTQAVEAAGAFQQSMETLVTSAGESQDKIAELSNQVLKLSVDTGTSTDQLAKAMYYAESANFHAADAIKLTTAAAEGAKAENASLDTVMKALTTTMTDYNMSADQSTQAMNGLIAIVQNGKTNLQDLASAMGAVLPVASSMGISFSQVGGAMAALTNAGYTARNAAQNLAHVLVALESPSGVAAKSMYAVGLSSQELKNTLVSKGLPEALQLIEDHVGKKFPAGSIEAETALKNILGGIVGLKLAASLTGPHLQALKDDITKVAGALNQGGDAVMGWDVVQGEFNFQLDRAKEAINAFMIILGQKLLPLLSPIVAGFTNFVTTIMSWIQGVNTAGKTGDFFIDTLVALGVNLHTAELIVADFTFSLHLIGEIAANVGGILNTLFGAAIRIAGQIIINFANGPLQDIIKGFNEVLVAIYDFSNQFSQIFQVVASILEPLIADAETFGRNFMVSFGNGIMSVLGSIVDAVVQVITEIENYLGFASPARKGPGQNVLMWGQGLVQGVAQGMKAGIHHITAATTQIASQIGQQLAPGALLASGQLQGDTGDTLMASVTAGITTQGKSTPAVGTGNSSPLAPLSGIQSAVASVGSQLSTICSVHATAASKCAADTLTNGLANNIKSNAAAVKSAADTIGAHLHAIPKHAAAAAHKTKKALAALLPDPAPTAAAVDSIGQIFDKIPQAAAKAAAKVPAAINQALGPAASAIKAFWNEVMSIFGRIADFLRPIFAYMAQTFQSQIIPAWQYFMITVKLLAEDLRFLGGIIIAGLIGAIAQAVMAIGKWIVQSGILKTIWDGLIAGLKAFIQAATSVVLFIDNVVIAITRWITSGKAAKDLAPVIQYVVQMVKDQFSIMKQEIAGAITAFQSIWKTIQAQLVPALIGLGNTLKPVALFIAGLIIGIFQLEGAMTHWLATSGAIKVIWTVLADAVKIFISVLSQVINAISSALQPVFEQLASTFETQVKPAWEHLVTAIKPTLPFLMDVAKFIGGILLANLGILVAVITAIIKGIGGLLTGIIQVLGGVIQFVSGFIQFFIGMWSFFMDLITGKWSKLGQDLGTAWQGIVDMAQGFLNILYGIFNGVLNAVIGVVSGFVQGVIGFFKNLYDDLVGHSIVPDIINGIMDWWKKLPAFFQGLLPGIVKWLVDRWNEIKNNAIAAGSALLKAVQDGWNAVTAWLKNWATDRVNEMKTWGTNLIKGFADSISAGVSLVTNAVSGVGTAIKNFLGIQSPAKEGPLSTSDKWMPNMMTMFASGISSNTPLVTGAINGVASSISGSMNQMDINVTGSLNNVKGKVTQTGIDVSSAMSSMNSNAQVSAAATNAAIGAIGNQLPQVTTQVQSSMTQIQSAMNGASTGAKTASQTITSSNQQVVSSTQQAAAAHSTLKTTIVQNSSQMASTAQSSAQTVSASYSEMVNQSKIASSEFAYARTQFQWALNDLQNGSWQGAVHQFQAGVSSAIAGVEADVASAAALIASMLGHSKPKEGPLRDDDVWGKHFVENLVGGIRSGMPALQDVTSKVAQVLASSSSGISSTINGQLTLTTPSSTSNQPMVIYVQLDSKTLGKTVTQYQARELRVQGGIRSI